MTGTDALGVPMPVDPCDNWSATKTDIYEEDEQILEKISVDDGDITLTTLGIEPLRLKIGYPDELERNRALWTVVEYCWERRVPGYWQQMLVFQDGERRKRYRLGALYRYAGYPLTVRDVSYLEYGERRHSSKEEFEKAQTIYTDEGVEEHAEQLVEMMNEYGG